MAYRPLAPRFDANCRLIGRRPSLSFIHPCRSFALDLLHQETDFDMVYFYRDVSLNLFSFFDNRAAEMADKRRDTKRGGVYKVRLGHVFVPWRMC